MKLRVHGATDVGLVREHNEDAFLLDEARSVFAVADGLGGMPGGEVASQAVVASLREQLAATVRVTEKDLNGLIALAHAAARAAGRSFGPQGIGTTLTLACVAGGCVHIGHIGDSFALMVRNRRCRAITREHNIENEREGNIDLTQFPYNYRYALTRVVGTPEPVRPEFFKEVLQTGDRLVLATDGLTDMVDLDRIGTLVADTDEPARAAQALVTAAIEGGGRDNITVIVIAVDES